jgi:RNA polymerase sigma-70 factor (ECF subfamily)
LQDRQKLARFEQQILPHLDAAYNLARWLTRNQQDAEDVVQDACVRAFRFFDGFNGERGLPWLLKIVRNSFYSWAEQRRTERETRSFDELSPDEQGELAVSDETLQRSINVELLGQVLERLPVEFREVIVLRELEGFSYKEIASIADIPIGTVMSRLARGRKLLASRLAMPEEGTT